MKRKDTRGVLLGAGKRLRPILLVLRIPPPYGGGEICAENLRSGVADQSDFIVFIIQDARRTRVNQGKLQAWKILEFLRLVAKFARTMIQIRPRLVFISMGKDPLAFARDSVFFWLARCAGCPVATELAGDRFRVLDRGRVISGYAKWVLKGMRSIRMLGHAIGARHWQDGLCNIVEIDNGVDVPAPSAQNARLHEAFTFLFVGAHSAAKGFDTLMDACGALKAKSIHFHLISLGLWESESFRQRMLEKVTLYDLASNLTFWGSCLGDEKWQAFRRSDVLVLPSKREGQPLSILEAFGVGLPVIATDVGAIAETVIPEKNGTLIHAGDVAGLADAMVTMVNDPMRIQRMGESNRIAYINRFTKEQYIHNMLGWLRGLAQA
jgi:glycosyltransferase involved in cell wall biosynthesis